MNEIMIQMIAVPYYIARKVECEIRSLLPRSYQLTCFLQACQFYNTHQGNEIFWIISSIPQRLELRRCLVPELLTYMVTVDCIYGPWPATVLVSIGNSK